MLTVLIPCAGSGRRFAEAGYKDPKPLIDVNGLPMVVRSVNSILQGMTFGSYQLLFVTKPDPAHVMRDTLHKWFTDCNVLEVTEKTAGAACTCLSAYSRINNSSPLVIANCDQIIDGGIRPLLETEHDGAILTMPADGSDRWSYSRVNKKGLVTKVAEKKAISDRANCGVYYWARGRDFCQWALSMVSREDCKVNGEYFVAPVYNHRPHEYKVKEVRLEEYGEFFGLGTPLDLGFYLKLTGVV